MMEDRQRGWEEEYHSKREDFKKFENLLKSLMEALLKREDITAQISSRTKSELSYKEKIERKIREGKGYKNPLNDITDIVGIRIITYYLDDIEKINSIIKKEFKIDGKNSLDKSTTLAIDQFGYKSVHHIISLSSSRRGLPEWVEYKEFKAEIQVRTILQHAWAEMDHEIRYKKDEDIPVEIKRRVYRLMALFELADEEFQNLKYDTESLNGKYLSDITWGYLKIKLNSLSLLAYLTFTKQDEKWMKISNKLVLEILGLYHTDKDISISIDIEKHFWNYENIADLEKLLRRFKVENLEEFDEILRDADQWGRDALRKMFKSFLDNLIDLTNDGTYRYSFDSYANLLFLICLAKADLIRANPSILDNIDYTFVIREAWGI